MVRSKKKASKASEKPSSRVIVKKPHRYRAGVRSLLETRRQMKDKSMAANSAGIRRLISTILIHECGEVDEQVNISEGYSSLVAETVENIIVGGLGRCASLDRDRNRSKLSAASIRAGRRFRTFRHPPPPKVQPRVEAEGNKSKNST